jgi:hypothetical protein
MCEKYKYVLRYGVTQKFIRPLYSDLKEIYNLSDKEHCAGLVPSVEGTIQFGRLNGFEDIHESDIKTKFILYAYQGNQLKWTATFHKTDCTINVEAEKVEVQMSRESSYNAVFDILDQTFNVVDFAPKKSSVFYDRRAILQVYMEGANTITNIVDGMSWEIDASTLAGYDRSESIFFNEYAFGIMNSQVTAIRGQAFIPYYNLSEDISGKYIFSNANQNFRRDDGLYTIREVAGSNDSEYEIVNQSGVRVFLAENVPTVPAFTNSPAKRWPFFGFPGWNGQETAGAIFTNVNNSAEKVRVFEFLPMARILSNKSEINGVQGTDVSNYQTGDEDNLAYKYAYPINEIAYQGYGEISFEPTYLPQIWDEAAMFENEALKPFVSPDMATAYPINPSGWTECGFWVWINNYSPIFNSPDFGKLDIGTILLIGGDEGETRDAFHLSSVIQNFLDEANKKSGTNITFNESAQYSRFLYESINPITNSKNGFHFITPKTNLLVENYDFAAKRGDLKLDDIFKLLWKSYRLKWYIDSEQRLRIEHIYFFENGGSYSSKIIGTDLTELIEATTEEKWTKFNSIYDYQKPELKEQYLSKWMDEQSEYFTGFPITAKDDWVEKGTEQVDQITVFSSDIDYANSTNETISKDGFFVLGADFVNGKYKIAYEAISFDDGRYALMQNGRWAFTYLHENFHRHNLMCENVILNQRNIIASSIKKIKTQNIRLNNISVQNTISLCRTQFGEGQIIRVVIDVDTQETELTILHETE